MNAVACNSVHFLSVSPKSSSRLTENREVMGISREMSG